MRFFENYQAKGFIEVSEPRHVLSRGHLSVKDVTGDNQDKVVWPSPGGGPNRLMPFGKDPYFDGLSSDTVKNSYLLTFTNKEIDYYLDLHYFGARYYHSTFPRFISPDPVSGDPMNPISWNRYLYCRNDPVNLIDPDGCRVEPSNARLGEQLVQFIARIEKNNGTHLNAYRTLQIALTYNNDYYLQANGVGVLNAIDFKHFLHTAFWASTGHFSLFGRLAGHSIEFLQGPRSPSYYSPEDVPSNNLGSVFGVYFVNGVPLSTQLRVFFEMKGVNMNNSDALEEWKKVIQAYNERHPNHNEYGMEDHSNFGYSSGPTDASGQPMWVPHDYPEGYAGNR